MRWTPSVATNSLEAEAVCAGDIVMMKCYGTPWVQGTHFFKHLGQTVVDISVCSNCALLLNWDRCDMPTFGTEICDHLLPSASWKFKLLGWGCTLKQPDRRLCFAFRVELVLPGFITTYDIKCRDWAPTVILFKHFSPSFYPYSLLLLSELVWYPPGASLGYAQVLVKNGI